MSSRAEIRAAYISKIRTMHPDVSTDDDATSAAADLNAAYAALMVLKPPICSTAPSAELSECITWKHVCGRVGITLVENAYALFNMPNAILGKMREALLRCSTRCVPATEASVHSVQELAPPAADEDATDLWDVFDITEAEPDMIFVNPFACSIDPLQWKELQVQHLLCGQAKTPLSHACDFALLQLAAASFSQRSLLGYQPVLTVLQAPFSPFQQECSYKSCEQGPIAV